MRIFTLIFLFAITAFTLGGCESAPVAPRQERMLVPTAVLRRTDAPAGLILPTNSVAELYLPRTTRSAYAPNIAEGSSYTIYTYDPQQIGTQNNWGTRYRYEVRQGFTVP